MSEANRRILLDACVPHWIRRELTGLDVSTAHFAGLDTFSDSTLLDMIEGKFDVLVTMDRNLAFQNNVAGRQIGSVVLRLLGQAPEDFKALIPKLRGALDRLKPGESDRGRVVTWQII